MKHVGTLLAAAIVLSVTGLALCQTTRPTFTPAPKPVGVIGTLVKVEGNNLVVIPLGRLAEAMEVTVTTDDKTWFKVDFEPGKLADLKPGMQISILTVPLRAGPRQTVTATSRGLGGTVVRLDGKNVLVRAARRGAEPKEMTVVTDEKTTVILLGWVVDRTFHPGRIGTLDDLKPGVKVMILPETGTAAKIVTGPARSPAARRVRVIGTLVKVEGNNLVVKVGRAPDTKEVTVATDEETSFRVDFAFGKLADLKPGMTVRITTMPGRADRPGRRRVVATSKGLGGTIVRLDGKNVVVRVARRGAEPEEVTVVTDEKTSFRVDFESGTLADLKSGMTVRITTVRDRADRPGRRAVAATSKGLDGTVVRLDGKNVMVRLARRGAESKEVTVVTDEKTRVVLLGGVVRGVMPPTRIGTLDDLVAGMGVMIFPETGTAVKIVARAGR